MKIALFVEGQSDKKTISILIRNILEEQIGVITRVKKRWDLLNEQKVYSYITNDIIQKHPDVSKIIVCVDSECASEDETERVMKMVENSIRAKIPRKYPIHYIGVIHALEGWLLVDPDSIREYLGARVRVNIPSSATLDCKLKEVMRDIFRKAGKGFRPTHDCPRIAEGIDIDKMVRNNESFARFREKVKDP